MSLVDGLGFNVEKAGSAYYEKDIETAQNFICAGSLNSTGVVRGEGKTLSSVGTGSPSLTWGRNIQANDAATGAGSSAWVEFITAFSAAPTAVQAWNTETADDFTFVPNASIAAGSFYVETSTASQDVSYVAIP